MATYDFLFDKLGLRDWCGDEQGGGLSSMADLAGALDHALAQLPGRLRRLLDTLTADHFIF